MLARRNESDETPGDGGGEPDEVVALLRAYRGALALARDPPPSLSLAPRVARLLTQIRPRFGCHGFETRYVRRRTSAVHRALAGRLAVGEGRAEDERRLEAVDQFRDSLDDPSSRLLSVAALVAAILLAQFLFGWLFSALGFFAAPGPEQARLRHALDEIDIALSAQSWRDVAGAVASADYAETGILLAAVGGALYILVRPLASGYRLSCLCTGRAGRLGRLRRGSQLSQKARELSILEWEERVSHATGARFSRDAPLDLVVKAVPGLVVAYGLIGLPRLVGVPSTHWMWVAGWVAASTIVTVLLRRDGWREWRPAIRLSIAVAVASIAVLLLIGIAYFGTSERWIVAWVWWALAIAVAARVLWLVAEAWGRGAPVWWLAVPASAVCLLAAVAPWDLGAVIRGALGPNGEHVLERTGVAAVPALSRRQLQIILTTHGDLKEADFRRQDLHGLSLAHKRLTRARFTVADLSSADLSGARLRRADLLVADLNAAVLRAADLRAADLKCTDLRGADLRKARLGGAHLENALADRHTAWPAHFSPEHHGVKRSAQEANSRDGFYDYAVTSCDLPQRSR